MPKKVESVGLVFSQPSVLLLSRVKRNPIYAVGLQVEKHTK